MIRLTALGSLELTGDDGRPLLSVLSQPRRLALLAYLTLARPSSFHRRDTLTALFWPDADSDHARDALSQALRFLRRSLGDDAILGRGAEDVGVARERVWCDVGELEATLEAGRAEEALALYRGELLEGFNISEAPDFERWLDGERARLRERIAGAAATLAGEVARTGNPAGAATWTRRAAALEPFDETLHRQVLEYLDAAGDRAGALQEHEAFRRRLRQELESEPAPETTALVEAIRQRAAAVSPRERPVLAVAPAAPEVPLVVAQSAPAAPGATRQRRSRRATVIAIAALLVLGGALAAGWLWLVPVWRTKHVATAPTRIVVIPFQNLGPAEDQYFADGVTDELTTRLAAVRGLGVISRTSANQYRNTTKSLRQIASELGVSYVLEGSVRWAHTPSGAGQVRITPQLIRVSDDTHVWATTYDRELREIFAIQSDMARNVAEALSVALGTTDAPSVRQPPTANLEAYDYYLRGRVFVGAGEERHDVQSAIGMLERAVALDPTFAPAWALLAREHGMMYWMYFDRTPARIRAAEAAIERAERLDPQLAQVHLHKAHVLYYTHLDYEGALAELKLAREGLPGDAEVDESTAAILRRKGDIAASQAHYRRAIELNPRSTVTLYNAAESDMLARDFRSATTTLDILLGMQPDFRDAHILRARVVVRGLGLPDSARRLIAACPQYYPGVGGPLSYRLLQAEFAARRYDRALTILEGDRDSAYWSQFFFVPRAQLVGEALVFQGDVARARDHFERARALAAAESKKAQPDDWRYHSALARALARLGRKDEAVAQARRATELMPLTRDAWKGTFALEELARVYTSVGEHDAALSILERLLTMPSELTVQALGLEPWWDPLRSDPRFQRLVQGD